MKALTAIICALLILSIAAGCNSKPRQEAQADIPSGQDIGIEEHSEALLEIDDGLLDENAEIEIGEMI